MARDIRDLLIETANLLRHYDSRRAACNAENEQEMSRMEMLDPAFMAGVCIGAAVVMQEDGEDVIKDFLQQSIKLIRKLQEQAHSNVIH